MSEAPDPNPYQSPPNAPPIPPGRSDVLTRVNGPSIGLFITGGIGIPIQLAGLALNILGAGFAAAGAGNQEQRMMQMFSGGFGIVTGLFGLAIGALIIYGAWKMRNLEGYGLAMTASILAMVPCLSPCCLIGLPFGIWAVVVLSDASVKAAFRA